MLVHLRTSGLFPWPPALGRAVVVAFALLSFTYLTQPVQSADPAALDVAEDFRQFLRNDVEPFGKLLSERKADEKTIKQAQDQARAKFDKLVKRLDSLAVTTSVLRLQEWESTNMIAVLGKDGLPEIPATLAKTFETQVAAIADANDRPTQQYAMSVLLGEEANNARRLKLTRYRLLLKNTAPQLEKLAKSDDRRVREAATLALAHVDAPGEMRVNAVKYLLEKDGSNVGSRRLAYEALATPFQTVSPRNVAVGRGVRPYGESDFLSYSADAKNLLEKQAVLAWEPLSKGLKDSDLQVRQTSIGACKDVAALLLDQIQQPPRPNKQIPYADFLKGNRKVIEDLQPLLDTIVKHADPMIEAAADPDPGVRLLALTMLTDLAECRNRILGWRGLFSKAVVEPEKKPDPNEDARKDPAIRGAALEALQPDVNAPLRDALQPGLKKALGILEKTLSDPDPAIRLTAMEVLEDLGDDAAPALPGVIKSLQDSDKFVRWAALRILNRFAPADAKTVVPNLIPLIRYQDSDMAKTLGGLLSKYGADAALAVPELTKAIQVGDPDARLAYFQTLNAIGPAAVSAIPAIKGLLKHENPRVRASAADSLGRFGKLAVSAEPELMAALKDEETDVRRAASEALLRISGK